MTDHIELTETSRLTIETDQDADCPRGDWETLTGYVNIPDRGDSRLSDVPPVHEPPIPIHEAHDRVRHSNPRGGFISTAEVVERWARVFHGLFLEFDNEHGGYWFVDPAKFKENWPDLVPGTAEHLAKEAEVITSDQETYRQWAESEVYGVILERRSTWVRLDNGRVDLNDPRDEHHHWDEAESVWGCYLDDDYTAQQVALEHFDLTEDESAALKA